MRYDLGDCTLWEYMFLSNEKPQLQIPDDDDILDGLDEDEVTHQLFFSLSIYKEIKKNETKIVITFSLIFFLLTGR